MPVQVGKKRPGWVPGSRVCLRQGHRAWSQGGLRKGREEEAGWTKEKLACPAVSCTPPEADLDNPCGHPSQAVPLSLALPGEVQKEVCSVDLASGATSLSSRPDALNPGVPAGSGLVRCDQVLFPEGPL